jgi:NADPH:quinone reductase-like Zn-dependent oxidoreductase
MDSPKPAALGSAEAASTSSPARRRTMKAIVRDRYGSADVLDLRDVEVPRVGDDQVLVRVRAAGLDRGAWHIMAGLPYLIRSAGYGVRRPKLAGLGSEVAGVVEAVGAKVRHCDRARRCSARVVRRSPSTRWRDRTGWRRCRRI